MPKIRLHKFLALIGALLTSLGLAGTPALADDAAAGAQRYSIPRVMTDNTRFISEIRGGLLFHDWDGGAEHRTEDGWDINAEILFARPNIGVDNAFLHYVLTPRPHIGASVSTVGNTSEFYAGVTWDIYLFGPVFIEASFGAAAHDGRISGRTATELAFGCRVMFRESFSAGVDVTEQVRVMATIDHMSHAGLCGDENPGLTNLGVRLGYIF